jgi:EPS-associated MarR family transcriptional regulator
MEILRQSSETREDLGLLAVMEVLEDKDEISQRELARVTGLNLKKVNYCLHKLLEKGYVKFERVRRNPDKRSYLYILTPAGLKAKSKLTYGFLKFTLDFYNQVEGKLKDCLLAMQAKGIRRIGLFGRSDAARIVIELGSVMLVDIVGISDMKSESTDFFGLPAIDYRLDGDWDCVLITDLSDVDIAESRLKDCGVDPATIWRLT